MTTWQSWTPDEHDPAIEAELEHRGFGNSCWRNDACPSFTNEARKLRLWIEMAEPEARETCGPRFCLQTYNDDDLDDKDVATGEEWPEFLIALDKLAPTLASGFTDHDFREFAARNFTRYMDLWNDDKLERDPTPEDIAAAGIVELSDDDQFVVDPYLSGCARFAVDPVETYGQKLFDGWKLKAAIQMAAAK